MSAISRSWKRAILKLLTYEHCLKMLLLHSNRDLGWTCTKQRGNHVYLLHIARTQAGKTRRIRGRYRRGTFPRRRPRQRPRNHQPPRTDIETGKSSCESMTSPTLVQIGNLAHVLDLNTSYTIC